MMTPTIRNRAIRFSSPRSKPSTKAPRISDPAPSSSAISFSPALTDIGNMPSIAPRIVSPKRPPSPKLCASPQYPPGGRADQ